MFAATLAGSAHAAVPPADHIVVVIMENKPFAKVYNLPYTATLRAAGLAKAGAEVVEVREAEIVIAGIRMPQSG